MAERAESERPRRGSTSSGSDAQLLGLLGTRIESLLERYRGAQRRVDTLRTQLAEREARIRELQRAQKLGGRRRAEVGRRLDRVIAGIERLEGRASP